MKSIIVRHALLSLVVFTLIAAAGCGKSDEALGLGGGVSGSGGNGGQNLPSALATLTATRTATTTATRTATRTATVTVTPTATPILACLPGTSGSFDNSPAGPSKPPMTMTTERALHASAVTGSDPGAPVLVAGGTDLLGTGGLVIGIPEGVILSSAELFNPVPATFSATNGSMSIGRAMFTATFIPIANAAHPNGVVLVVGGFSVPVLQNHGIPFILSATAELYDVKTGMFSAAGSTGITGQARAGHTATLLADKNTVLITGGLVNVPKVTGPATSSLLTTNEAELYDAAHDTFTFTSSGGNPTSMTIGRAQHTATLIAAGPLAGQVLITGGLGQGGISNSAELYNPATQTFAATTTTMSTARALHAASALADGRVLVSGGVLDLQDNLSIGTASAEIFDPTMGAAGSFRAPRGPTPRMSAARAGHSSNTLPGGTSVLVAGGVNFPGVLTTINSADTFNGATESFSATGNMTSSRFAHAATSLNCGNVLLTGGIGAISNVPPNVSQSSAELYHP